MKIVTDTDYINNNLEIIKINSISELKELNIEPDIINISKIENKKDYKELIKYLKNLNKKILIINDKDKYLKKIFLHNLDIYRYGNKIYDDIEYVKKDNKIIIKYDNKKYELNTDDEKVIGYIIIGLLIGKEMNEIISILEKTS